MWRNGALVKVAVAIGDFPAMHGSRRWAATGGESHVRPRRHVSRTKRPRRRRGRGRRGQIRRLVRRRAGGDIIRKVRRADVRNMDDLMREVMSVETTGAEGAAIYVDGPNGPRWLYVDMLR